MIPAIDNSHATEAKALLTSMFVDKANVVNIGRVFANRVQDLEDAIWQTIAARMLDNAVGDAVDKWGKIVGEARNGMVDADYKLVIRLRIRTNNSNGLTEDLIQLVQLASPTSQIQYQDYPPNWEIAAFNFSVSPTTIAKFLKKAKAVGTYGVFIYSTWLTPFVFDSFYGGSTAQMIGTVSLIDSVYGGVTSPKTMTAAIEIS